VDAPPPEANPVMTSDAPTDPCMADPRCRTLVDSARTLSKAGQYEAACLAYKTAYSRQGAPWLLLNIGRMQQRLGLNNQAKRSYELYLSTPPPDPSTEEDQRTRQRARDFLGELAQVPAVQPAAALPGDGPPPSLNSGLASSQPAIEAAPSQSPPPMAIQVRPAHRPRPTWRLALGGALMTAGAVAVGVGAGFWSLDGQCTDARCITTYHTGPTIVAPLLAVGLSALGAGAVTVALRGPVYYEPVLQRQGDSAQRQ
jgi:tetratricopeptide (TPR) repeat protein